MRSSASAEGPNVEVIPSGPRILRPNPYVRHSNRSYSHISESKRASLRCKEWRHASAMYLQER